MSGGGGARKSIRFTDLSYWYQRAFYDQRFRWAMTQDVTALFEEEIKKSVREGDNNCGFCWGTKNSGKSEYVLAIALFELYTKARWEGKIAEEILTETPYGLKYTLVTDTGKSLTLFVNFNLDATLKVVLQAKKGDIIIQDEITELMGLLSETAKKKLFNILSTVRVTMVSFYFVSTDALEVKSLNFYLETCVKEFDARETWAMLYNKKQKPVGMVKIPLHGKEDLRKLYQRKKREFAFGMLEGGGRQYILPDLEADALKIVEYVREKNIEKPNLSLLNDVAIELNIPTETDYYKRAARKARLLLAEAEGGGGGAGRTIQAAKYEGQTADLRRAVLDQLEKYTKKENVDIFEEWVGGELQRDIAGKHGVSQTSVSLAVKEVREKFLGYAFEDVYYEGLGDGWTRGGRNTDEPDFLNEEEKKVVSAKCYADKAGTVTIHVTRLGRKELELKDRGWELQLVFYNITWDQDRPSVILVEDQTRFTFTKN